MASLNKSPSRTLPPTESCRSELARDGPKNDVFILKPRVIVNDHREQARSYRAQAQASGQVANR